MREQPLLVPGHSRLLPKWVGEEMRNLGSGTGHARPAAAGVGTRPRFVSRRRPDVAALFCHLIVQRFCCVRRGGDAGRGGAACSVAARDDRQGAGFRPDVGAQAQCSLLSNAALAARAEWRRRPGAFPTRRCARWRARGRSGLIRPGHQCARARSERRCFQGCTTTDGAELVHQQGNAALR